MRKTNTIDRLTTSKLLHFWSTMPNPTHKFFRKYGVDERTALQDISYSAEVQSAILARESAVIGDAWDILGEKEELVNFIRTNFEELKINHIFREIFSAIWFGYTVLQHPMEKHNGKWMYTKINSLPSKWFAFSSHGELIPSDHSDISPLNIKIGDIDKECELVQYRASFVNPYGESQLARVFWSATLIAGNLHMWSSFIDRFGDDSLIAKADMVSEDEKLGLMQAISDFRSSGGIVLENTQSLEVLNTNKNASALLFKSLHEVCTQQISKLILGHASALEAQAGKLGNDEALSIVRKDITQDDKVLIADTMNRLIKHLCLVNGFTEIPKFMWIPERDDEKQKIERDKIIAEMGFEFSEEYMRKAYRLEESDLKKTSIQAITNFSEGSENEKKFSEEYFENLDKLVNREQDNFRKPFIEFSEILIKNITQCAYWGDAFESILKTAHDRNIQENTLTLSLLNAYAIGQSQIKDKVESLQGVSFSEQDEVLFSTFEESKKYFTGQLSLAYEDYQKLEDELKMYAFSVRGITKTEQVLRIADILANSYNEGMSFTRFKKSIQEDKELSKLSNLTNRHLNLVYMQNMHSAYAYGRYAGLMEAKDIFPNWEYITIGDSRVRPSHAAVNGTVRRYDDPFWNQWYPPNGFRCRCVVELTDKDVTGTGIPKWDSKFHDTALLKTGSTSTINKGKDIVPDKGFTFNRGRIDAWLGQELGLFSSIVNSGESAIIGNRKQFINTTFTQTWTKENFASITVLEEVKITDAKRLIESLFDTKYGILDKFGMEIFIDTKSLISHLEKDWSKRQYILPVLDKVLKKPAEIWGQLEQYGKSKKIVGVRKYFINVNNEPWVAVVEYPRMDIKTKKDVSGLPVLTTIYPLDEELINQRRTGILLK